MIGTHPTITKQLTTTGWGLLGVKKNAVVVVSASVWSRFSWKKIFWLSLISFIASLFLASVAEAATCVGGVCHIRSTTIDFTVSSDDLTASTALITWTPYEQFGGSNITVSYANDTDESMGYWSGPPANTFASWIGGLMYPTVGAGGAITQAHTFHNIIFNPPAGVCQGSPKPVSYTAATARVTITDAAGNVTTTDFLIVYDCDQDPPAICRSCAGQTQCDTGVAQGTPSPISIADSQSICGYCHSDQLRINYVLYCVKADGTLKAVAPPYDRYGSSYPSLLIKNLVCDAIESSPDTAPAPPAPRDIYVYKGNDPDCQTYEFQACQAVGQTNDCAWYKWRYTFGSAPWLKIKGGSIRTEGEINLANSPPAGECSATFTISANGAITNTAKNSDCSALGTSGQSNVKGNVTSGSTNVKSSRGVIDIASILKGRYGKVYMTTACNLSFDSDIKNKFNTGYDVVAINCNGLGEEVTINLNGSVMEKCPGCATGNKTVLVQGKLNLTGDSLAYDQVAVTSPNQLSSLGWIVQKANQTSHSDLVISSNISNLAGSFYVNGDIYTGAGQFLTVQGAMVATGQFHFERIGSSAAQASETIWDDGRAWLNPPPGFVNILSGLPHSTSLQVSPNQ